MLLQRSEFQCPSCGKQLNAPDSAAGVTAPCPYCKTRITAPSLPSARPPAGMSPLGAPASQAPPPPGPAPLGPAPSYGPPLAGPPAPGPFPGSAPPPYGAPLAGPQAPYHPGAQDTDISGLNWGAFFFTWIWGIAHGVWISLLCFVPYVGIVMPFVLLFKGNEWAWERRQFSSVYEFRQVQRAWAIWGLVLVPFLLIPIMAGILFPVFARARAKAREASARQIMMSLQSAEQNVRANSGRYISLTELKKAGTSPVADGEVVNGYTFTSNAGAAGYTIVATPSGSYLPALTLTDTSGLSGGRVGGSSP